MDTVLPGPISQLHQLLTRLARTPVRYQLSLTTEQLANPTLEQALMTDQSRPVASAV
jgi:hypothetical protein